jgi:hypothetical protein
MHRTLTIKIKVKPNKTLHSETPPLFIKVPCSLKYSQLHICYFKIIKSSFLVTIIKIIKIFFRFKRKVGFGSTKDYKIGTCASQLCT